MCMWIRGDAELTRRHRQQAIKAVCEAKNGNFSVKNPPRASSNQEENQLASLLERMEKENREIDGDSDDQATGNSSGGVLEGSARGKKAESDEEISGSDSDQNGEEEEEVEKSGVRRGGD